MSRNNNRQAEDDAIKEKERLARRSSRVVPNLSNIVQEPAVTSPSGRPVRKVTPGAAAVGAPPNNTQRLSQEEQNHLMKERERAARMSVVPNLASLMVDYDYEDEDEEQTTTTRRSAIVPNLASQVTSYGVMPASEPDFGEEEEKQTTRQSTIVPNLVSQVTSYGSSVMCASEPTFGEEQEQEQTTRHSTSSFGSRNTRTSIVPNLADQISSEELTPSLTSPSGRVSQPSGISPVGAREAIAAPNLGGSSPMPQREMDRLTKEREAAQRRDIPGPPVEAGAVSIGPTATVHSAGSQAEQDLLKKEVGTTTSGLSQRDLDLQQKERERQAGSYQVHDSSQASKARYNVVAELLGEEGGGFELFGDQMSYSPTVGGDSVETGNARRPSTYEVESEETVRARYQAATMVMDGQLTQEDEDRMMKERERQAAQSSITSVARQQEANDAKARARNSSGMPVDTSDVVVQHVDVAPSVTSRRGRRSTSMNSQENKAQPKVLPGALAVNGGQAQQRGKARLTHVEEPTVREYIAPAVTSQPIVREFIAPPRQGDEESDSATAAPTAVDTMDRLESQSSMGHGNHIPDRTADDNGGSGIIAETAPDEEPGTKELSERLSRQKWYIIGGGILLIIIAVGVGVALAIGGGDDGEGSPKRTENAPTLAPTSATETERRVSFRKFLIAQAISTEEQLTDAFTPQYKALTWLSDEDTISQPTDEVAVTRRYVMAVFYYSMNGENWVEEFSWLDPRRDVCDWDRITCAGGGVKTIEETKPINMIGTIPTELNALPYLEDLILGNNQIRGLAGPIENLRILSLQDASLGERVRGIPTEIFEMTNLVRLFLSGNGIVGTISTEVEKLQSLSLWRNSFSGTLSTHFQNMPELTDISVSDNDLSGDLMEIISGLTGLRAFIGTRNKFTGTVGPEIAQYTGLQRFEVSGNDLGGPFPNAIFNVTSMGVLHLSANQFTGTLSSSIAQLTDLQTLDLSRNAISGSVPPEVGRLSRRLLDLQLQNNFLEGTVPTEVGQLIRLNNFDLSANSLVGPVPTELGNMQSLDTLFLATNQLTGPVPTELGNLRTLNDLRLVDNFLTGTLPSEICNIPPLNQVFLTSPGGAATCGGCPKCV